MMDANTATKGQAGSQTHLLFRWRNLRKSPLPILLPLALASLAFSFLVLSVRVKVRAPQFEMANKASWIQLSDSTDSSSWAVRANENGPMLSRYELSSWHAYAALENGVMQATQMPSGGYVPRLRTLPQECLLEPMAAAAKGETVFPRRAPEAAGPMEMPACKLAPVLYPLCALGAASLPHALPPFAGKIDTAMTAADWRFLLRLHPGGGVADCVALTQADAAAPVLLENWLRGVTFDARLAAGGGWIAVGLQFNNHPIHGSDPR